MKTHAILLLSISCLIAPGLTSTNHTVQARAAHPSQRLESSYSPAQKLYYNAIQKKDLTAWGVAGDITWTDPALNGGTFSGHRVALSQQSPWRYAEIGWVKRSTGLFRFVTYEDGSGPVTNEVPLSTGTHSYAVQYDPNSGEDWFYVGDVATFHHSANFTSGDRIAGGEEVLVGVESMGRTQLFNLTYSVNDNGNFTFVPWDGSYTPYVQDYPYCNIPNGPNSFYDTECPYRVFLPLLLK